MIRVYIPTGYADNGRRFPVIYMHDGQNLFEHSTAFAKPWDLIPIMNKMPNDQKRIIVGIDNSGNDRIREYAPFSRGNKIGLGNQYLEFIIEEIKPLIDREYRTLSDAKYTWMIGSSMGGLITFHAGLHYANVFGKIGVISPSFWYNEEVLSQQVNTSLSNSRFYLSGSRKESPTMEINLQKAHKFLKKLAVNDHQIKVFIRANGIHNEDFWAREFTLMYELFSREIKLPITS